MKKYVLPVINCIVICSLSLVLNLRDDTPIYAVFAIIGVLAFTIYLIKLIKNNGNEIKINAMNKIITLGSIVLITGCLYEIITGNTISDKTGDYMAIIIVIIGLVIWIFDYYVKPFKR